MKNDSGEITYQIFPQYNLFVAIVAGEIRFQDLYQHVQELMEDKGFYLGINGLYDFTRVTSLTGQIEKFENLADEMSDQEIISKPANTSIVIASTQPSVRAMMEGYLLMTSSSNVDYRIFDRGQWPLAIQHVGLADDVDPSMLGLSPSS